MKFAALIAITSATELFTEEVTNFLEYLGEHGKSYATPEEFNFRLALFNKADAENKEWNANPNKTSSIGHNFTSDMTKEEFKQMLGFRQEMMTEQNNVEFRDVSAAGPVDWRAKGAVTPVKNQGGCGSCWAFSTTGSLEGAHFIEQGQLVSLSESQFVNCARTCHGCQGGLMDLAFKYAETNPVMREADWGYQPHAEPLSCYTKYKANKGVITVTKYADVPKNDPEQLKAFLQNGPVSVAIEADKPVFQRNKGEIISGPECGTQLDHGVLAVGWGNDATAGDFIIVKNSWGPTWSDKGYVRLASASGAGTCGINQSASQPQVQAA